MGDSPENLEHAAGNAVWSTVEQGFFESAPPDRPEPTPEPLRFDDLEDPEDPERARRAPGARLRRAAAAAVGVLGPVARRLLAAAVPAGARLQRQLATLVGRDRPPLAAALGRHRLLDRRRTAWAMAGVVFAAALPAAIVTSHSRSATSEAIAATAVTRPIGPGPARIPPVPAPAPIPSPAPAARPALASKEARPRRSAGPKRRLRHRAHRRSGRR